MFTVIILRVFVIQFTDIDNVCNRGVDINENVAHNSIIFNLL